MCRAHGHPVRSMRRPCNYRYHCKYKQEPQGRREAKARIKIHVASLYFCVCSTALQHARNYFVILRICLYICIISYHIFKNRGTENDTDYLNLMVPLIKKPYVFSPINKTSLIQNQQTVRFVNGNAYHLRGVFENVVCNMPAFPFMILCVNFRHTSASPHSISRQPPCKQPLT